MEFPRRTPSAGQTWLRTTVRADGMAGSEGGEREREKRERRGRGELMDEDCGDGIWKNPEEGVSPSRS
jgi:hypothetical protein